MNAASPQPRTSKLVVLVVSCLAMPAFPGAVLAHALGVECRLRQGKVEIEAFYSDDTPAQGAEVSVRDERDKEITAGRTDQDGRWSFAAPPPGQYQVVVEAGAGHRAKTHMTVPQAQAPGAPADALRISDGAPRGEFTRFPWLKVVIGLGAIGCLGVAFWLSRRKAPLY